MMSFSKNLHRTFVRVNARIKLKIASLRRYGKNRVIDELERLAHRENTAKLICAELNNFVDLHESLITIVRYVKTLTGCSAVGIRLHENGDYPYYVHEGFSESFIRQENSLLSKDGSDTALDCMCGNVICGRFDLNLPFFTTKGSFWTNSTTALLAATKEEDRRTKTRNHCNKAGYESVALIPILARGERNGLIQLNDQRMGMFDEEIIEYIEMIGEQIGLAVKNQLTYSRLKVTLEEINILKGIIRVCASCKKVRDEKGTWQEVEAYIKKHSESELTQEICPDCQKKDS